ncbi:MAG: sensor histidine kinase, partial [Myxococcales bacterium]
TALFAVQRYLENAVTGIEMNLQSVRVAQALALSILEHGRTANRYLMSGSVEFREERDRVEAHIRALLREANTYIGDEQEHRMLEQIAQQFELYLKARRMTGIQPGTLSADVEVLRQLDALLDELDRLLQRYVDLNIAQSNRARGEVHQVLDRIALIGRFEVALALAAIAALAFVGRRYVFVPLLQTRRSIAELAQGADHVDVPTRGVRELREIAEALNDAARRLSRQRDRQLGFVASVAHDLRNPLSALRSATAILRREGPLPPEDKLRHLLALIDRQITRLDRMVGDLLESTRIQAGKLELKPERIDLRQTTQEVVELFREASNRHIELVAPETPCLADADPLRVEQVLGNLVSNALKYSPETSPVSVRLTREAAEVRIAVSDRGIGIPPEELPHVFEPFRRAKASRESVPGVGLGLAVAQKIARGHSGRIEVTSEPGAGSTFTLVLPAAV